MFARISLLLFAVLTAQSAWAGTEAVAQVDGTTISRSDLDRGVQLIAARNHTTVANLQHSNEFPAIQRAVLNSLVEQEILWQAARVKYAPGDAEVDNDFNRLQARYGSKADFIKALQQAGQTEQTLRRQIRRQLAISKYMAAEITKKIHISDADIKHYYDTHREVSHRLRIYRLRELLIPTDTEDAKATAEKLDKEAKAGANFAALARKHSADGNAALGGDLGFVAVNLFPEPFKKAVHDTKTGQVSGVVKSKFGYQLIKVEDVRGGQRVPLAQVHDHIRQLAFKAANTDGIKARIQSLVNNAKVKILIKPHVPPVAPKN